MSDFNYVPMSSEMLRAVKAIPTVATERKKLAKQLRAAHRRNAPLTRLLWRKHIRGYISAMDLIFTEGTGLPFTGLSLLIDRPGKL